MRIWQAPACKMGLRSDLLSLTEAPVSQSATQPAVYLLWYIRHINYKLLEGVYSIQGVWVCVECDWKMSEPKKMYWPRQNFLELFCLLIWSYVCPNLSCLSPPFMSVPTYYVCPHFFDDQSFLNLECGTSSPTCFLFLVRSCLVKSFKKSGCCCLTENILKKQGGKPNGQHSGSTRYNFVDLLIFLPGSLLSLHAMLPTHP